MPHDERVTFNRDEKYDIQLSQALIDERRLAEIFCVGKFEKIELKTESFIWRRSGKIAIEYRHAGRLSGISATQADFWIHELMDDERKATLGYFVIPVPRLKELCRDAFHRGSIFRGGGDDGLSDLVLLRISDLLGRL